VRDPVELCRLLGLPRRYETQALAAAREFPLFVPWAYLRKIRPGDAGDPLLRQVLPLADELETPPGYTVDPLAEDHATLRPGVIQKYAGRVLIVTTGVCAVHCRYCFRRHFPYEASPRSAHEWQPALDDIARDATLTEVILSGGDPLMLVDEQLAELVARIESIDHVRRLRVHTRLPVMVPERVTDGLLEMLGRCRPAVVVVIHANHPAELDGEVAAAIRRLASAGPMLLNQSVLLRGVNDTVEALAELSERLVDLGVMPYYLHQLDPVLGAAHFEVPCARGIELVEQLRARLPGYAVPRYVCEIPGRASKTVLA